MASELAYEILKKLAITDEIDTYDFAETMNLDHQKVIGAVKSLQALGNLIIGEPKVHSHWELTDEGKMVAEKGSHEAVVYNSVPITEGIDPAEILKNLPNGKVGLSKAMSLGWVCVDKSSGKPLIKRKIDSINDIVKEHLNAILKNNQVIADNFKQDYKKRRLINEVIIKSLLLQKGPEFSLKIEKPETDLTADLLIDESWEKKVFKEYNFDALGVPPSVGCLHPLMKVRSEFRKIFLEMGFQEMPTNNFVESSFWNFDALFQPQQHPARDAHDTFFVSHPCISKNFPSDYSKRVKTVHSIGGYGSTGYKYNWKMEEAQKNLLRTHTTAVSARMLYKLAQEKEFKPVKYFSIDRVFRNETLDSTHLAEFHQVEGLIADYSLTLGDLIGVLYTFFQKLGISKLNFKPAYNPYTEPSMEIFSFHHGLKKWIEIGNSGMFRPEMLLPMGFHTDINVIAWGLSLERPTMIKYNLNNIRDLVGPKVDLCMVQASPLCRLDK